MDMNKPTLIATIVLVFVAGLVFGSFSSVDTTTGQVSRTQMSTISISPTQINTGESISITVLPGSKGAEKTVWIYGVGDLGQLTSRRARTETFCLHGNTCTEPATFSWQVPNGWNAGTYAATITDVGTGQRTKAYFTVAR